MHSSRTFGEQVNREGQPNVEPTIHFISYTKHFAGCLSVVENKKPVAGA